MFNFLSHNMLNVLSQDDTNVPKLRITRAEYENWKKLYTFDALQHPIRYGQSFCNHFNITDYILYYTKIDVLDADTYITKNYVK